MAVGYCPWCGAYIKIGIGEYKTAIKIPGLARTPKTVGDKFSKAIHDLRNR